MSDLQKAWARKKLQTMATVDNAFDEQEEDSGAAELPDAFDDSSSASSASSVGTIIPSPTRHLFARPQALPSRRTMDPVPWTTYFERELYLPSTDVPELTYHAYLTSPVGNGPLFVTHHGAGSSGLSFAVLSTEIREQLPNAGILSIDARGHGLSSTTPSNTPLDLSLQTLSSDLLSVLRLTQSAMSWPTIPPIVLVGHSLGGAVVTHLATTHPPDLNLLGYAVLDVVEGSAMDALQSMQTYLSTRPTGFASVQAAIEWHVRSRTVRNGVSARVSVPALLVESGKAQEKEGKDNSAAEEDVGTVEGGEQEKQTQAQKPWRWRTDLAATQPFWEDWFTGLSKKFLSGKAGKLLLLAGTDRLDTVLTIGQMQGKYALQVFPEAGHFIQEDLPEKTATVLVDFYKRNDTSALVLPPKVSELLAKGRKV